MTIIMPMTKVTLVSKMQLSFRWSKVKALERAQPTTTCEALGRMITGLSVGSLRGDYVERGAALR